MQMLSKILLTILSLFLLWYLWRIYQRNPQMFSRENWGKSFFTMGVLALILIGVIAICVFFLRSYGH
ncbi:MAG: hypothetical protein JW855_03305 [Gammaproteobacteria bacterium]|nr:hypothetical protein [Gammaproteobacteria bacterium]